MSAISFIGAGNMACALVMGLLQQGQAASSITLSGPRQSHLDDLVARWGVQATCDNRAASAGADVVVLAVKPQMMQGVCREIAPAIRADALVISVAAGIRTANLHAWLDGKGRLVRAMPNTPARVGLGATGLFGEGLSAAERAQAEGIMAAVGQSVWVAEESLMDVVTAVSGSGPAYYFLFMEAMVEAAQAMGLDGALARQLVQQTALGAATLAQQSPEALAELRRQVTSPKGTTEQAILAFEAGGLRPLVATAMAAARLRAQTLADELGA